MLAVQTIYANLFVITALFVVIGFGMVFIYFKKTTQTAMFLSLFTVSFTIIGSPILQKFWYNVFLSNFGGQVIS
jgi:hypothetical protein